MITRTQRQQIALTRFALSVASECDKVEFVCGTCKTCAGGILPKFRPDWDGDVKPEDVCRALRASLVYMGVES